MLYVQGVQNYQQISVSGYHLLWLQMICFVLKGLESLGLFIWWHMRALSSANNIYCCSSIRKRWICGYHPGHQPLARILNKFIIWIRAFYRELKLVYYSYGITSGSWVVYFPFIIGVTNGLWEWHSISCLFAVVQMAPTSRSVDLISDDHITTSDSWETSQAELGNTNTF